MVIGALAAFVLLSYIQGLEDEIAEDQELVETVQAKAPIEKGTSIDQAAEQGLVGTERIPRKFKPANAINRVADIAGRVAVFDIAPDTVILDSMFVDSSFAVSVFRDRISNPGYVTVTIQASGTNAVADNIVGGDYVNILTSCTGFCGLMNEEPLIEGITPEDWIGYRYLYQNVHVMAVGKSAALDIAEQVSSDTEGTTTETGPKEENRALVTFDVPPDAAQMIASLEFIPDFDLYLSLVPREYEPAALPPIAVEALNALPGEAAGQLTPYGPEGWTEQ